MATKYSQCIITESPKPQLDSTWAPVYKPEDETMVLHLDSNLVKGLPFYTACYWFWPAMVKNESAERSSKPHSHTYDEIIGLIGTDPNDPWDLCGESLITLGGEEHHVTNSSFIYIPAGLEHGPFREISMKRPIIQLEFGNGGLHT